MAGDDQVRLDKWLWAARFFKTRSLAHDAVEGGKVHLDGLRVKPSRAVHPGQELCIVTNRGTFTVKVEAVSSQRGSASIASRLFRETAESKTSREHHDEMRRIAHAAAPDERPNTQDRRAIRRMKEG